MAPPDFSDAALVLIGHGSTLNADSSRPVHQHADALRANGRFAQVLVGFWKEEPSCAAVLRGVWARRVFVVPLFISEGYFTEQVIPRELGLSNGLVRDFPRTQQLNGRAIHYCDPVGTHPGMTDLLLRRAQEIVGTHPRPDGFPVLPRDTSLFIAGHGTGNNENSRKAIEAQVERIRAANQFAEVQPAFMEEEPRISEIATSAVAGNIVVVPFFISDGLHTIEDIPVLLGEDADQVQARLAKRQPTWTNPTQRLGRWVWYSRCIGNEPFLTEVILQRAMEMAGESC